MSTTVQSVVPGRRCVQAISPARYWQAMDAAKRQEEFVPNDYEITTGTIQQYRDGIIKMLELIQMDPELYHVTDVDDGFILAFKNPDVNGVGDIDEAYFSLTSPSRNSKESSVNLTIKIYMPGVKPREFRLQAREFPLTAFTVDDMFDLFYHNIRDRLDAWRGREVQVPQVPESFKPNLGSVESEDDDFMGRGRYSHLLEES